MNYWLECVQTAMDEIGIIATGEQAKKLAECVESAHDNYGMAHGHDCIPNPDETARREDACRHYEEVRDLEQRELLFKKHIAAQYNTDVHVSVRDGRVEVTRAR